MQPELHVNPHNYEGHTFPNFGRPTIIACIGLENLKFARQVENSKDVKYDLNLLINKANRKPDDFDDKLTELLQILLEHESKFNFTLENSLDNSKFFCYRGLMTCIACTPYERQEPWKIVAMLHKGNIYLCARPTEEKLKKIRSMTPEEKRYCSWGYKFEQYIMSDRPDSQPNVNMPVDETEDFSLVFTTHLNKHTIVYGAEMDGIRCDLKPVPIPPLAEQGLATVVEYLSDKEFIELKTSKKFEFSRQEVSFRRYKTKKWWCQSFLGGIDTVLCGFRTEGGIVEELKIFNIRDLSRMSQQFWDPCVCFNFLDTFLTYVRRCLGREIKMKHGEKALQNIQWLPIISLLFEWRPGMPVQVAGSYSNDDDPILPEWFLNNYAKGYK